MPNEGDVKIGQLPEHHDTIIDAVGKHPTKRARALFTVLHPTKEYHEATKIKAEENEDEEERIAKIEETEAEEEDHQEATNIKADENEDEEENISFGRRTAADDASTCLGRCSCSHRTEAQALARHREFQSGAATAARLG